VRDYKVGCLDDLPCVRRAVLVDYMNETFAAAFLGVRRSHPIEQRHVVPGFVIAPPRVKSA
jgi:hypothetical protein